MNPNARQTPGSPQGPSDRGEAVAGVVFCGGKSRRMGTDKARLVLGGTTLLERSIALLEPRVDRLMLACGAEDRYQECAHPRVLDRLPDGGPLAGLEAALLDHEVRGGGWLLVLACDVPEVSGQLLDRLLEEAVVRDAEAMLACRGELLEPLVAVYHTRVRPAVTAALERGERRLISFHQDGAARVATLEVAGDRLTNVNTPEQFRALSARVRGGECA